MYYTTKVGDTLFSIATQVYGDSTRWYEIFRNNQMLVREPSVIPVGTVLRLLK